MQDKQRGMPIVFRYGNDDAALSGAVWQCTESTEALGESLSLSPESRALLASFRSERRRREWLTVRRLLNELHPDQPAPRSCIPETDALRFPMAATFPFHTPNTM